MTRGMSAAKSPALVNGDATSVLSELTKAALIDLVADLVRRVEGTASLDGGELVDAVARHHVPVAAARGDRPAPTWAKWQAERDRRRARHARTVERAKSLAAVTRRGP